VPARRSPARRKVYESYGDDFGPIAMLEPEGNEFRVA
jgi:hypothetical protein